MLVITAAVPAERGALVIKALQEIVDARKDEREACHQSALAATSRRGNRRTRGGRGCGRHRPRASREPGI